MKTVRYIAFSALAAAGIALSACQPEQYWKDSAEKTGGKVTFTLANKTIEYTYKPEDQMDVVGLEVTRNTSTGVDTLFFKTACSAKDSTFVSCDNFAVFADGKNVATLDFRILQQFELGQSASITVAFADTTKVSPSGVFQATFKIMRDYSWTAIEEKGMIVDNLIPFEDYKATEVVFEQSDQNPNIYRIVDAYAEGVAYMKGTDDYKAGPDKYLQIQLLKVGDVVGGVSITKNDLVYFKNYQTGWYYPGYGEVFLVHPFYFNNPTEETAKLSKVLSYQKDAPTTPELVQLAPFYAIDMGGGQWATMDYTGYNGVVYIAFPGCKIKDFGVAVEYTGYTKNAYDEESIGVKISSVGADVDTIKIAYGLESAETLFDAVAAGIIPTFDVAEGGEYQIPIDSLETGVYNIVAVTFNKAEEGVPAEAQDYDDASFKFSAGGGKIPSLDTEYTIDDFDEDLAPADTGGFFGEYLNYTQVPMETGRTYVGKMTISPATEDTLVTVNGFFGEGLPFDDTVEFEFYEGILFPIDFSIPYYGYTLSPAPIDMASMTPYPQYPVDYFCCIGFVAPGQMALVDYAGYEGMNFNGVGLLLYDKGTPMTMLTFVAGNVFADPNQIKFLPSVTKADHGQYVKDFKFRSVTDVRRNLVETRTGYIKSTIDRMWAEKRAAKAAAAQAPSTGKVRFPHSDVELVRVK